MGITINLTITMMMIATITTIKTHNKIIAHNTKKMNYKCPKTNRPTVAYKSHSKMTSSSKTYHGNKLTTLSQLEKCSKPNININSSSARMRT
jgi:hypothetical protein